MWGTKERERETEREREQVKKGSREDGGAGEERQLCETALESQLKTIFLTGKKMVCAIMHGQQKQ